MLTKTSFISRPFSMTIQAMSPATNTIATRCLHHTEFDPRGIKNDMIGPADPVSNLRPVCFRIPNNESELEKILRLQREEVQNWNQKFWTQHNSNFFKQKKEFMQSLSPDRGNRTTEKKALTSEEMSSFYKDFLDNNWETHWNYNKEWYKRNFKLLFLSYRVKCENVRKKFFS